VRKEKRRRQKKIKIREWRNRRKKKEGEKGYRRRRDGQRWVPIQGLLEI
jgi:hypothetical protein